MSVPQSPAETGIPNNVIDLKSLLLILWRGKVIVLVVTILAAAGSVVYALSLPNIYSTSALLAPKNIATDSLGRVASQYGGLASLAGINLGTPGGSDVSIAIETMKSQQFFRDYVYETVLVELMAPLSWEQNSNKMLIDPEIYDSEQWIREVDYPRKSKPSVQEAFRVFSGALTIAEDKKSGFVTVSAEHLSPEVARRWVDLVVTSVNDAIREATVAEAQSSIEYLTQQLKETVLVNLDEVFAQLIEEQTKKIMLAHASKDYVFQVIDPPIVSEYKAKPARSMICVLGTMLGAILAVFVVFLRHYQYGKYTT